MTPSCQRCGRPLPPGAGRYILTMTFVADVDFELPPEGIDGNMEELIAEIERTPEEELDAQVYQRRAFLICRSCKEELARNPFENPETPPESLQ